MPGLRRVRGAFVFFGCATAVAPLPVSAIGCGAGSNARVRDAGADATTIDAAGPDSSDVDDGAIGTTDAAKDDAHAEVDSGADDDASVPDTVVRFIAVGDTGLGNSVEADVARSMEKKCAKSGCDFAIMLGDNIYDTGVTSSMDPQWVTKFEAPYARLSFDFYAALGNHDYGGGGVGDEWGKAQYQLDYAVQSTSQKFKMPSHYYSFRKGPVEFFVLDTNSQLYGRDAQQRVDMTAAIGASKATWKIAYGHHPYRSNGPHGNAGTYDGTVNVTPWSGASVKSFMDSVVCGKTDVYFSGHDHSLQWLTDTCSGTELLVSGAGAQTSSVGTKNATYFAASEPGFVYVVVQGRSLTATFVDTQDRERFTRTVTK